MSNPQYEIDFVIEFSILSSTDFIIEISNSSQEKDFVIEMFNTF